MNRCDCGACLSFHGVTTDPSWLAWRVCPLCGTYYAADAAGGVRYVTRSEPPRRSFRVPRDEET